MTTLRLALPRCVLIVCGLFGASTTMSAVGVADINTAVRLITQVAKLMQKYDDVEIPAPQPTPDSTGFVSPYEGLDGPGPMTQWAEKSLTAEVGGAAGEAAGDQAGNVIAQKVPFGGLLRGKVKNTSKTDRCGDRDRWLGLHPRDFRHLVHRSG